MLKLIELTKKDDTIYTPVIQSTTVEEVVKQSTEVLQIEAPIRQSTQTDVKADEQKVEDKNQGKSLFEVQNTMRENLKKQVEEAMKKNKKK